MRIIFFCNAFDPIAIKCFDKLLSLKHVEVQSVLLPGHGHSKRYLWAIFRGMGLRYFCRKATGNLILKLKYYIRCLNWVVLDHLLGKTSSVLEMTLKHNCPVLIMQKREQESIQKKLQEMNPDLLITCSFPIILKKFILEVPKLGGINVHPSLLPKYRGPSPIFWVLLNGEQYTGVTIHYLSEKIDTGDILLQQTIGISPYDNLDSLTQKIAEAAADLLGDLLQENRIESITPISQIPNIASYQRRPDEHQMRALRNKLSQ
jgi:folate-dependent phosphoribosylglycinamide formyltransferase PurN